MSMSILRFGATEPPSGASFSADADGSAGVIVVPALFHQLKVAGLLLGGSSHAGQLQSR